MSFERFIQSICKICTASWLFNLIECSIDTFRRFHWFFDPLHSCSKKADFNTIWIELHSFLHDKLQIFFYRFPSRFPTTSFHIKLHGPTAINEYKEVVATQKSSLLFWCCRLDMCVRSCSYRCSCRCCCSITRIRSAAAWITCWCWSF